MTRRHPAHLLAILLLALGAVALIAMGCGGGSSEDGDSATAATSSLDGLSANEVLEKARGAATSASSVQFEGAAPGDGDRLEIDVEMVPGTGAKGSVKEGDATVAFVASGDRIYVKLSEAAFTKFGIGGAQAIVGDRYVAGDSSNPQFGSIRDFTEFSRVINGLLDPEQEIARVAGKDIDGTPTVGLKSSGGATLYVADEGEPHPLLLEQPVGDVRISFTWNEDVSIEAPPSSEVVDISSLTS